MPSVSFQGFLEVLVLLFGLFLLNIAPLAKKEFMYNLVIRLFMMFCRVHVSSCLLILIHHPTLMVGLR